MAIIGVSTAILLMGAVYLLVFAGDYDGGLFAGGLAALGCVYLRQLAKMG